MWRGWWGWGKSAISSPQASASQGPTSVLTDSQAEVQLNHYLWWLLSVSLPLLPCGPLHLSGWHSAAFPVRPTPQAGGHCLLKEASSG